MSVHLVRAEMLLRQSRAADAEREAGLALAQDPRDPHAHAVVALCRVELKREKDALAAAESAVGLAPDVAYFHYVRAFVLHHLDRDNDALRAIEEAIRLDPEEEDNFSMLASIQLARRDWPAALAAAEAGLALNPEHVQSVNLRAMALVRLGRKEEATQTGAYALERAPENAVSHANQGWTCLHRNDPRKAQDHFREALRLDPGLEYARHGMLEALKARNPVYRGMLAYFLWMGRQSAKAQWAFIIGSYVLSRFARSAAETSPQLGWVLWPIVVLFYLFVYLTWTAVPMFNLLLRFDRFGRLVLSREERTASNWFGGAVFLALASFLWMAFGGGVVAFCTGIAAVVLSVCLAATLMREKRPRWILGGLTAALALIAGTVIFQLATTGALNASLAMVFFLGFLGFQIAANVLRN